MNDLEKHLGTSLHDHEEPHRASGDVRIDPRARSAGLRVSRTGHQRKGEYEQLYTLRTWSTIYTYSRLRRIWKSPFGHRTGGTVAVVQLRSMLSRTQGITACRRPFTATCKAPKLSTA